MDKLVPIYKDSIFNDDVKSVCSDLIEVGIDSVLESGLFQSIPIVGVLVGVGKLGQNIYERNLLRQTISFINELNRKEISQVKLDKYRRKLDSNSDFAEAELGRVIITLNSNVDIYKSQILGCLYRSRVDEKITWNQFCELTEITNRVFIQDISVLKKVFEKGSIAVDKENEFRYGRLEAVGLIVTAMSWGEIKESTLDLSVSNKAAELTSIGQLYCMLLNELDS